MVPSASCVGVNGAIYIGINNLEFSRWGSVFGDDQMAAAVIDRIVHHGRLIQFHGESYRVRHALMQEG